VNSPILDWQERPQTSHGQTPWFDDESALRLARFEHSEWVYAPVFEISDSVPQHAMLGWFVEWSVAEFPWINTAGFQISL